MDLSKQKQTESKKLNVLIQYLVMADLLAIGNSDNDAYTILFQETSFDALDLVKHQQTGLIGRVVTDEDNVKRPPFQPVTVFSVISKRSLYNLYSEKIPLL